MQVHSRYKFVELLSEDVGIRKLHEFVNKLNGFVAKTALGPENQNPQSGTYKAYIITDSYALMQHHAIEYAPVPYNSSRIAEAGKRRTDNEEKFNPSLSRRKEEEGVELSRTEDGRICCHGLIFSSWIHDMEAPTSPPSIRIRCISPSSNQQIEMDHSKCFACSRSAI